MARTRGVCRRLLLGGAALAAAAAGLVQGPAGADESAGIERGVRIAALVPGEPEKPPLSPDLPQRPRDAVTDLKVLLAQNGGPTRSDAVLDEILVALASSSPHSIDDDIALRHGLELIERTELPSLGLRVVTYRVRDVAAVARVLADLAADQRIRRAQMNAQYQHQPLTPLPPVAANPKRGPAVVAKADPSAKAPAAVRLTQPARVAKAPPPGNANAASSPPEPLRVGQVGDVLSGGL